MLTSFQIKDHKILSIIIMGVLLSGCRDVCWRNIVTTYFVLTKEGATIAKHTATISKIRSQKLTENSLSLKTYYRGFNISGPLQVYEYTQHSTYK